MSLLMPRPVFQLDTYWRVCSVRKYTRIIKIVIEFYQNTLRSVSCDICNKSQKCEHKCIIILEVKSTKLVWIKINFLQYYATCAGSREFIFCFFHLLAFFGLWSHYYSLSLHGYITLSSSVYNFILPFKDIVITFSAHHDVNQR